MDMNEQRIKEKITNEFYWFHKHPELSFKEYNTTSRIRQDLKDAGIRILDLPLETGLVAEFGSGSHLVALTPIPTVPAGIYAGSKTSLDQVADGDTVAVPNDAANTARAYALLQKIGWIKLNPDKDLSTVTQQDIVENPHHLKFTEMKSLTIPGVRNDFDFIVITGSIVYNAKIDPSTALAKEDILPHLLLQLVVEDKNKDAQWAKDIVAAYHSDEFKKYMKENNNGLWFVPEDK